LNLFTTFDSILRLQITVTFGSVLGLQVTVGLQVNTGLQPPTRREPFVAGTMLHRPEPTEESSSVFNGMRARHLPRAPSFWVPPSGVFPLFLVKNLLPTDIMCCKADRK